MKKPLLINPIFTGLTRPPMVMGITLDYLSICFIAILCIFILADNPLYLVLYVPFHVLGWIACKIDPNIFRILMKKSSCSYSPNKNIWGCKSYEPF